MRLPETDADADADAVARGRRGMLRRVLAPHRLAIALAFTLVLAGRVVLDPSAYLFLSGWELALASARHALDLLPVGVGLLLVYGLADEALPPSAPWRLPAFIAIQAAATVVVVAAYFAAILGLERLPSLTMVATQSIGWGTAGILCALIAEADRRARRLEATSLAVAAEQTRLAREETEQQLQLLQAQIEPHFLFNTLANLRRLYRMQPDAGAQMFARLQHYLQSALPQLRRRHAPLGDELTLLHAYLDLFQVRMGERLRYAVDVPTALRECDFPPVLLLTLVENALKHGLDPKPGGGRVDIRAHLEGNQLCVEVADDGVGFGGASTGGTGVGLVNVRRRLATLYGARAGFELVAQAGGGVVARVRLPAVPPVPSAGGAPSDGMAASAA